MLVSNPQFPTTRSDHHVSIGFAQVKSVKTDNMKKEITVTLSLPLNGDNFMAANQLAFFAFDENPISVIIETRQPTLTGLDLRLAAEAPAEPVPEA